MHGGFTNRVCDFSWNQNDPWVMLGTAEDNQMQVFRPARSLVEAPPANKEAPMEEIEE
jgi:histone-binding protein RBBP4